MSKIPVIAIFDAGKTNKKLLLFNEQYQVVHEKNKQFDEITDEDGFPCEDVQALTSWVRESFNKLLSDTRFDIKAVNFSAYGASFVYLDTERNVVAPLYNYLKPYPSALQKQFYNTYGGESLIAIQTASPVLGSLNSGMQLYRLKYEKPELFNKINYALHLPQYLSYILSGTVGTDITSIGCHTNLWDFQNNNYHQWVQQEGLVDKFPAIRNCKDIAGHKNGIPIGIGLHDSSAALIPYLTYFKEPFILISTGTWCISLNPFNHQPLTIDELQQDCLCYMSYQGNPVKASRLFAGYEHEQQSKQLAERFNKSSDHYKHISFDASILKNKLPPDSYETAYHQLIGDISTQQFHSTLHVLNGTGVKRIFVDGGFSSNSIYMQLLAEAFPAMEVYAATIPQASSLGAALSIHASWNNKDIPMDCIKLKYYTPKQKVFK